MRREYFATRGNMNGDSDSPVTNRRINGGLAARHEAAVEAQRSLDEEKLKAFKAGRGDVDGAGRGVSNKYLNEVEVALGLSAAAAKEAHLARLREAGELAGEVASSRRTSHGTAGLAGMESPAPSPEPRGRSQDVETLARRKSACGLGSPPQGQGGGGGGPNAKTLADGACLDAQGEGEGESEDATTTTASTSIPGTPTPPHTREVHTRSPSFTPSATADTPLEVPVEGTIETEAPVKVPVKEMAAASLDGKEESAEEAADADAGTSTNKEEEEAAQAVTEEATAEASPVEPAAAPAPEPEHKSAPTAVEVPPTTVFKATKKQTTKQRLAELVAAAPDLIQFKPGYSELAECSFQPLTELALLLEPLDWLVRVEGHINTVKDNGTLLANDDPKVRFFCTETDPPDPRCGLNSVHHFLHFL
jgi:hypothetical protein